MRETHFGGTYSSYMKPQVYNVKKVNQDESAELRQLVRLWAQLKLRQKVLYLKSDQIKKDKNDMQLVLTSSYHAQTLKGCQVNIGHLGVDMSLNLLWDRFYWPNMQQDAEHYICNCEVY